MKKLKLNPSTLRVLTTSDLPCVIAAPSKVFNCAAVR